MYMYMHIYTSVHININVYMCVCIIYTRWMYRFTRDQRRLQVPPTL